MERGVAISGKGFRQSLVDKNVPIRRNPTGKCSNVMRKKVFLDQRLKRMNALFIRMAPFN
jgi:hypothetical protein